MRYRGETEGPWFPAAEALRSSAKVNHFGANSGLVQLFRSTLQIGLAFSEWTPKWFELNGLCWLVQSVAAAPNRKESRGQARRGGMNPTTLAHPDMASPTTLPHNI